MCVCALLEVEASFQIYFLLFSFPFSSLILSPLPPPSSPHSSLVFSLTFLSFLLPSLFFQSPPSPFPLSSFNLLPPCFSFSSLFPPSLHPSPLSPSPSHRLLAMHTESNNSRELKKVMTMVVPQRKTVVGIHVSSLLYLLLLLLPSSFSVSLLSSFLFPLHNFTSLVPKPHPACMSVPV